VFRGRLAPCTHHATANNMIDHEEHAPTDAAISSSSNSSAISLYFAGVSRYPLDDARVAADWLGSAKDGSQPRFLDKGAAGDGLGDGRR
jgi:hypothetical protein